MITVCLTHDVDRIRKTYQYVTKPLAAFRKGNVSLGLKRLLSIFHDRKPYWGFDVVTAIEEKYGVKSTFFFLDESYPFKPFKPKTWKLSLGRYSLDEKKVSNIIRFLDNNGWEIGLHGSYRSYNDIELLKKEKSHLENILGKPVAGIRQHYLNMDENTWKIQDKAGFKYDSTLGLRKGIGFKDHHIRPFFPIEGSSFCEIPLTLMDGPFHELENKWDTFEDIINLVDENNGCLVINYHTNNFDELDHRGYKESYERIIEIMQAKKARFATMKEVYEDLCCLNQ